MGVVGTIRDSIQGIDGFSIVKELIQNADDSGSTKWVLGLHDGFPNARHPLLRSGGMFVVNNGDFRREHARALVQLHLSGKAGDQESIGKFGVGLKSVYHLGEAFFYLGLASPQEDFDAPYGVTGFVSPWVLANHHSDSRHEWNLDAGQRSRDEGAIREAIQDAVGWSGFTLWVPLRRREHCQLGSGKQALIQSRYFEEGEYPRDIFSEDLERHLARLWPMLRNLENMRVIGPKGGPRFSIRLKEGSVRRRYPISAEESQDVLPASPRPLQGYVAGDGHSMMFAGLELAVPDLLDLRAHPHWPTSQHVTEVENIQVPDKSLPHVAAVFSLRDGPTNGGSLTLNWSVFLPVLDEHSEHQSIAGDAQVHLNLHGYFFLSTDRTRILDWRKSPAPPLEDERAVQRHWNALLARKGTLPAILDALEVFKVQLLRDSRAGTEVNSILRSVTSGLQKTQLYAGWCDEITGQRAWLWKLGQTRKASWQLTSAEGDVLACPSLEDLVKLFANLEPLDHYHVTDSLHPILAASAPRTSWDASLLDQLLQNVDQGYIASREGQRALVTFLEAQEVGEVQEPLATSLRRVVGDLISHLWKRQASADQEALRSLLLLIPKERRLPIPGSTPATVIETILKRGPLSAVIYPESIGVPAAPKLDMRDAHRMLQACQGQHSTHQLVKTVIAAVGEPVRTTLLEAVKTLDLFPVTGAAERQSLTSFEVLRLAAAEGRLFEPNPNQFSLVPSLQASLAGVALLQLDIETAELLGLEQEKTDRGASLRVLARVPTLVRESAPRIDLVARLGEPNVIDGGATRIQRYLLHAEPSAFEDTSMLFVPDEFHPQAAAIVQAILESRGEAWRWLGSTDLINARLTPAVLGRLNVRRADLPALKELLRDVVRNGVFPLLDGTSCDYLLANVDDVQMLRALPIHQASDGRRTPLTENAWLESDYLSSYHGSPELLNDTLLIRRHPDLFHRQAAIGLTAFQAADVVRLVLQRANPEFFWRDIMAVLPHVPSTSIGSQLGGMAWLPTTDGRVVRPERVLQLPELSEIALEVVAQAGADLVVFEQLAAGIRDHPCVTDLEAKVLPSREEALDLLGAALGKIEAYWVGDLNERDPGSSPAGPTLGGWTATAWLEAMGDDWSPFPVRDILSRLPADRERIWAHVQMPIALPMYLRALEHLRTRHFTEPGKERKKSILDLHNRYLQLAVACPGWSLHDERVQLLSQTGDWKRPTQLCHGQLGVARSFLVEESQAQILGAQRVSAHELGTAQPRRILPRGPEGWATVAGDLGETAQTLREYFSEWSGHVRSEMIGGLLALLGDDHGVRDLAKEWLGNFSIENVRTGFDAEPAEILVSLPNTLPEKIEKNRFIVKVESASSFEVESLVGTALIAEREANPSTLIAGTKETGSWGGTYYVGLRFHKVDPEGNADLGALLRNTAEFLYRSIYTIPVANVVRTFDVLAASEQLDLEVAQDLCLDSAFHYMHGQLGARSPALDKIFRTWNDAQYSRAELRRLNVTEVGSVDARLQSARDELRREIEEDSETARILLTAVRKKMKGYEYRPDSIPFELLQNADDAIAELRSLDPDATLNRRFAIELESGFIDIMHWGRPINYGPRDLDHHRDLEKMLTINASDKGAGVTGKFGLGFKSVFLLTENPKVVSRDLGFEVTGGVYPQRLHPGEFSELRSRLEERGGRDGTIIRLAAQPDAIADATNRFLSVAPLTLLFTREVDEIEVIRAAGKQAVLRLRALPSSVPEAKLRLMPDGSRVLLLGDEHVTLALRVEGERVTTFPNDPPDVWITMPTRTRVGFGFLLQGAFDPDVGRGQLATSSEPNLDVARKGAPALLRALVSLSRLSSEQLKTELHLISPPGPGFWRSVFDALATGIHHQNRNQDAVKVAWTALWDENGAARRWIETVPALPTGLPGPYELPLRLSEVSHVARGSLAEHELFRIVAESPAFRSAYPAGHLIANPVASRLRELSVPLEATDVTLADAIEAILGPELVITPKSAAMLAPLIDPSVLEMLEPREQYDIQSRFGRARFKSQAGAYHPAPQLLPNSGDDEVARLLGFAPSDSVLADDYQGPSLRLFEHCRGPRTQGRQAIAAWVLQCDSDTSKLSALRYLLDGADGPAVAHFHLSGRAPGSWLADLDSFSTLSREDKHRIRQLLSLDALVDEEAQEDEQSRDLASTNPRELFEIVHERWGHQAADLVAKYEARTYPWPLTISAEYEPQDLEQRRGWLTLLLLGAMPGLGRVRSEQNRDFLKMCERKGWMDVFVTAGLPGEEPTAADRRWLQVIEGHLAMAEEHDDQGYRYWFRMFVTIYQLSTWLDKYAQLILGLNHAKSAHDIQGVWSPNTSPAFTGSGISVPPLDRALKHGRHFVLRELRRKNILTNRLLDPYAFVTSGRVKDLFGRILRALPEEDGHASNAVYRELAQALGDRHATLDGGYDLPFQFGLHESQT